MLNFSAATGRTLVGFVADRVGPVNALWSVIMLSGLTQMLVWSFVGNYAGIVRICASSPLLRKYPRVRGFAHGCFSSFCFVLYVHAGACD